jgi:hypothetical protein
MTATRRLLHHAAFAAGLAVLGWVAVGAFGANPLALVVTLVIAAFYAMGAAELQRFQRGTTALGGALAALPPPPAPLGDLAPWLDTLPAPLRPAVRQRIDSNGRTALPGLALAPYLTGLLVLLGMLGTFLGMVLTLHGTGLALEQATELDALRNALSAPVKGLGLAFGTSVAGVATSAMLGLMTALARRERAEAVQALDRHIATTLQPFTQAHRAEQQQHRAAQQHDDTLRALRQQAEAVPALMTAMVDTVVTPLMERLQALMTSMEQQHQSAQQRLHEGQQQFHQRTEAAYGALATSVERTLKDSLADSAAQAHATLQPLLETTLAGLAREAGTLHAQLGRAVQQQLDGITERLGASSATQAAQWRQALDEHRQQQQAGTAHLQAALERFTATFDERTGTLVDTLATRLGDLHQGQQAGWAAQEAQRLATWQDSVATMTGSLREAWQRAAAQAEAQSRDGQAAAEQLQATLQQVATTFEQRSTALVHDLTARFGDSHAALQATWAARDAERLAAWQDSVATMAGGLREAWQQAGAATQAQQQQVCDTLARTAREMTETAQAQARETVAEIGRLLQAAAEAPRAAAEVIGELRDRLTDAMARDNTLLDERQRLLETLSTLLGAVNQASHEQRAAIDALVGTSATLLREAGERLQVQADTHGAALADAAAQVNGSAVEMAAVGDAFGFAVQRFGDSNEALMAQLQRIEAALSQSITRSDEQLAYYVAQAREVIDLSLSSQQQIVEDLQQLARRQAA